MTSGRSTLTDPRAERGWCIGGAVVRLREHGTSRTYPLPDPPRACTMGVKGELRLVDRTGTVSRTHAEMEPVEVDGVQRWKLRDLQSKNGLRCDGELCTSCLLRAGVEVSLGSLRLIAESEQSVVLLDMLRRFMGWAEERQEHVDQAGQGLRSWATRRAELLVIGEGDLVPSVRRLNRLVIGESVPLSCGPSGGDAAAMVRAAADGTLCIQVGRQAEAMTLVERWRECEAVAPPPLILCAEDHASAAPILEIVERTVSTIHIPSLVSRVDEREALVQAYAEEVARELRLAATGLTMHDMEWLRTRSFDSLAAIEDTARRLVTIRTWGARAGAGRLGIDESTLRSWARRRGLPL